MLEVRPPRPACARSKLTLVRPGTLVRLERHFMNYRRSEAKDAARAQFRGVWAGEKEAMRTDLERTGLLQHYRESTAPKRRAAA